MEPYQNMSETYLTTIRNRLEKGFIPSSAGYCAATTIILNVLLDAHFFSTYVNGESHWFSRIDGYFDVDLTGDQFGFSKIQITKAGHLYPNSKKREKYHLRRITCEKAYLLAKSVNMLSVAHIIKRDFL